MIKVNVCVVRVQVYTRGYAVPIEKENKLHRAFLIGMEIISRYNEYSKGVHTVVLICPPFP